MKCQEKVGCTKCEEDYEIFTPINSDGNQNQGKKCRKKCKSEEYRSKTTGECNSCLTCNTCQIGESLICPECDFCSKKCEFSLLKIKKSEFLIEGRGINFNLYQITRSNELKDYSIESSDRGPGFFWLKSRTGAEEAKELIIQRSNMTTGRCTVSRPVKLILQFEDDTEHKFNQSVKNLGSVLGASAVAISFVSIANVNSFHSLIVIINTNKVFNYMFVLEPQIKGILRYINQIDTLLNFDKPDLFMRLLFPYKSESWTYAVHTSIQFHESLTQEKSFFGFKLFLIGLALPLIWLMNLYYMHLKKIYSHLSKVTPRNKIQLFSKFEKKFEISYYNRIEREFKNRKKFLYRSRKFLVFKFFGSRNRYVFSLLSIFAPDFGHILAKLVMYSIYGNSTVRLYSLVFIFIWLGLLSLLTEHIGLRIYYLWHKKKFKPRQKKEFSLYLKNISFIVKVFFMVFFFLIFSKWPYFCLVVQIFLQMLDMFFRFRFAFLDCRRSNTLSIFFELLIENIVTGALVLLLSSYGSESASKFILSFDIFMIIYNVGKASLFVLRVLLSKDD